MLDRIVMNIIHVPGIIGVISDLMFPKAPYNIRKEVEQEGMDPVLLRAPAQEKVDAIVTVNYSESKRPYTDVYGKPGYGPGVLLAGTLVGSEFDEVLSLTIEKHGVTYYSNYQLGETINPDAFRAVGDEGKVSMFYLLRHQKVDPAKEQELLKQLKSKL